MTLVWPWTPQNLCIHLAVDSHCKKSVLSNVSSKVNGTPLRSLKTDDQFSYLGVRFSPFGLVPSPHSRLFHDALKEIAASPLKSHQRLEVLRTFLIPRHLHTLVLGVVHKNTLKCIDNEIRNYVRAWLRLPHDTPIGFFHTSIKTGGLGTPSLESWIPLLKKNRMESLLSSPSSIIRFVVLWKYCQQ